MAQHKNVLVLALGAMLLLPQSASAINRPDALGYSGVVWPNCAIFGRTVSKKTKFGTLICVGAGVHGSRNRACHWK